MTNFLSFLISATTKLFSSLLWILFVSTRIFFVILSKATCLFWYFFHFKSKPKFLDWILSTDKQDHTKIFKDNIKPFEILFFEVGAEILKNINGFIAVNPDKAVQKIRKDVVSAFKDLQKPDKIEKLKKLKIQIEKLQKIGGLNAVVPSEWIVFKYKGKVYKFTGAFAPINQILGSLKFG